MNRHTYRLSRWALLIACGQLPATAPAANRAATQPAVGRLNILLITADDMNFDCLGVTGCKIPGISPHVDKLASEGVRFNLAHVTVAVCQPCRSVLMTGRYPFHSGALGFEPIRHNVPTLGESLRAAGYMNGIFAKVGHLQPLEKFRWDVVVQAEQLGAGRDPELYYQSTRSFIEKAKSEGKPFFLMANSQDPHRPFAGSESPQRAVNPRRPRAQAAGASANKSYSPEDVEVPCFLPDLPAIRRELAQYYTSVHRCDETVGQILRALDEAGCRDSTLVMFLSDNGMPFPFSKTNCYPFSTRTPWIVRWPGKVEPGTIDTDHFISGIDFMPTVLDVLRLTPPSGMDGRSFLPLLSGQNQDGRDRVYTTFHQTAGRQDFPMRCIQNKRLCYIFNAWSDGKTVFKNEARGSPSFKAMEAAAKGDPAVAARVEFFSLRTPEELYDWQNDPCCLHNLARDPQYQDDLRNMREQMAKMMAGTGDPLEKDFDRIVKK